MDKYQLQFEGEKGGISPEESRSRRWEVGILLPAWLFGGKLPPWLTACCVLRRWLRSLRRSQEWLRIAGNSPMCLSFHTLVDAQRIPQGELNGLRPLSHDLGDKSLSSWRSEQWDISPTLVLYINKVSRCLPLCLCFWLHVSQYYEYMS